MAVEAVERMIGLLVEHYAGAFPFWLAPVQCALIPIADRHHAYAQEVAEALREAGFRTEVDNRNENWANTSEAGRTRPIALASKPR